MRCEKAGCKSPLSFEVRNSFLLGFICHDHWRGLEAAGNAHTRALDEAGCRWQAYLAGVRLGTFEEETRRYLDARGAFKAAIDAWLATPDAAPEGAVRP